jgi:hypothetical protein
LQSLHNTVVPVADSVTERCITPTIVHISDCFNCLSVSSLAHLVYACAYSYMILQIKRASSITHTSKSG